MQISRSSFPPGFLFGAATSSYQIEGHGFGGAGSTHWDSYAATAGNVFERENGRIACDHYHRFDEDLEIASGIGLDAWRFSTSWARVLPEGRGRVNQQGLDFYDCLVDAILEHGLKPYPTLYHWELPSALADQGGWANASIADWFADFAELMGRTIGDRIHGIAPINEPWCVAWLGHFVGRHAPGTRDIRAAARAMHHVPLAHGRAVQALRAQGVANIGAIVNFEFAQPADDDPSTVRVAALYDAIFNRWFLGAMRNACYPDVVLEHLEPHLPSGWAADMPAISTPVDWIGVNYYTRKLIKADDSKLFPGWQEVPGPLPNTGMGWEIYPEGLGYFLSRVHEEYAHGLPIYVTESGMADLHNTVSLPLEDQLRTEYIQMHLDQTLRAINSGVDVRGFFIWSMLDNYEWAHGYKQRFGLVHVDFETLVRTRKGSCHALQQMLGN